MLNKHEDARRVIYDWANGDFKSAKAIIIKQEIALGNHYHENKDEEFFLLRGKFKELYVAGSLDTIDQPAPCYVFVPKGAFHRFVLEADSILLGVATELFDEKDEHRA